MISALIICKIMDNYANVQICEKLAKTDTIMLSSVDYHDTLHYIH